MRDDLTDVLEEILFADVLLIGSPIYLGDITGAVRSFLERLIFMNLSYGKQGENTQSHRSNFNGRINTGFIYTMNIPAESVEPVGYQYNFDLHKRYLGLLNGEVKSLIVPDTYQFDDYQKYDAFHFDEQHKAKIRKEQFPVYCQKAFDLGAKLASLSRN